MYDGSTIPELLLYHTRMEESLLLFDLSLHKDVVSWITAINSNVQNALARTAVHKHEMEIHDFIIRQHIEMNIAVQNASIDMYGKSESIEMATKVFDIIPERDAASRLGALGQGQWVHAYIDRHGVGLDANLSSILINMYSKCGFIRGTVHVFEAKKLKKVDNWNTMIVDFTSNGHSLKVIELFSEMLSARVNPNEISLAYVLNACSHGGLDEEGNEYLTKMMSVYGLEPDVGHYGCMADLFSPTGSYNEVEEMIKLIPTELDTVMWRALMGAYRIHRNFELGEKAGYKLIEAALEDHAGYVLLSNIYAMSHDWHGVHKVRKEMNVRSNIKPGTCVYNPMIDGLCKAGEVEGSNSVLMEMKSKECSPDQYTYTILMLGHFRKGKIVETIDLFDKMVDVGCTVDSVTIGSLVSFHLKIDIPDERDRLMLASKEPLFGVDGSLKALLESMLSWSSLQSMDGQLHYSELHTSYRSRLR